MFGQDRAAISVAPPVPQGQMIVIGFSGNFASTALGAIRPNPVKQAKNTTTEIQHAVFFISHLLIVEKD